MHLIFEDGLIADYQAEHAIRHGSSARSDIEVETTSVSWVKMEG
jgi:hypothetical protein